MTMKLVLQLVVEHEKIKNVHSSLSKSSQLHQSVSVTYSKVLYKMITN